METMGKLEKLIMKELDEIAECDEIPDDLILQRLDLLTHSLKSIKAIEKTGGSVAGQSVR